MMDVLIIGIFIIGILFCIVSASSKKQFEIEQHRNQEKGLLFKDTTAKYLGGFPTIQGDKKCSLELRESNIGINIDGYGTRIVNLNNISDIRIISKEQLQEKINLGKLIIFGIYSLAMARDTNLKINNFLKITYNNGNENIDLIFTSDRLESTCIRLKNAIN